MRRIAASTVDLYADLHEAGRHALHSAELSAALDFVNQALEVARDGSRPDLEERAQCSRAAVLIECGRAVETLDVLQRILSRSRSLEHRYMAAMNLAVAHRALAKNRIARFHGQIALQLAEGLGSPPAVAQMSQVLAMCWLGESQFERATELLQEALRIGFEPEASEKVYVTESSLGYSLALQGKTKQGLTLLRNSLDAISALGCLLYAPAMHLNLGFACLESGKAREAREQGKAVLEMQSKAIFNTHPHEEKSALYLVGEACSQVGEKREASSYFETLQRIYYPDHPSLPQVLLQQATHSFVNWLV